MTPLSRSKLGLNIAQGQSVVRHLQALHDEDQA